MKVEIAKIGVYFSIMLLAPRIVSISAPSISILINVGASSAIVSSRGTTSTSKFP